MTRAAAVPGRVLIDLSVAPSGGAATYAAGFARGMAEWGDPVLADLVVVVDEEWSRRHADLVSAMASTGATVVAHRFPPPGTWAARLGRGRVLRRIAAEHTVSAAFFPRDAAPRMPVPVVVLANNLYAWRSFGTGGAIGGRVPARLLRMAARRTARRAHTVLAVSRSIAADVESVTQVSPAAVVHHGCNLPEHPRSGPWPDDGEAWVVITVANLIENKGIETVLSGVAAADGGSWDLRVYGRRMDEDYAAQVEALGRDLFGRSVFQGPVYDDDLVDAYQQAHIVVVGGSFESFCYPLVEAMRSGCVVVAPQSDLVADLCGDVAVTYREGDAVSLAQALQTATREPADRSARGVERSRRFRWADTVATTVGWVRSAAGAPSLDRADEPERTDPAQGADPVDGIEAADPDDGADPAERAAPSAESTPS